MSVKHEMVNITYDSEGHRFGKWSADCRCRKWVGLGKDQKSLNQSFKEHVKFVNKQK